MAQKRPAAPKRRPAKPKKRGRSQTPAALVFLAGAAAALMLLFFGYAFFYLPSQKAAPTKQAQTVQAQPSQAQAVQGQAQATQPAGQQPDKATDKPAEKPAEKPVDKAQAEPQAQPPAAGPMLTIVIDDLGGSKEQAQELLDLGIPVTFSIIPNLAHTRDVDEMAAKARQEVILHQPMEAHPPAVSVAGTLKPGMSPREVSGIITAHLGQTPHAVGLSNHTGSKATEDAPLMAAVMAELKLRPHLFFLDSRTTDKSVALREAQKVGVPALGRTVFIDAERGQQAALLMLKQAEREAKSKGRAIAIGHPHPETLAALASWIVRRDKAVSIVPLAAQLKAN